MPLNPASLHVFVTLHTMRPETFRVGNGIFLPNITFSNVTSCRDPAKKWTRACATHPRNCCSSVLFRNSTAYPSAPVLHTSSAGAHRFAFVVCGSALGKLGHMQPEWLHHRRNSVKHLSLLPPLPRKDLLTASAPIAQFLLLAASPSITLTSLLSAQCLYPQYTLGEILQIWCFCFCFFFCAV